MERGFGHSEVKLCGHGRFMVRLLKLVKLILNLTLFFRYAVRVVVRSKIQFSFIAAADSTYENYENDENNQNHENCENGQLVKINNSCPYTKL